MSCLSCWKLQMAKLWFHTYWHGTVNTREHFRSIKSVLFPSCTRSCYSIPGVSSWGTANTDQLSPQKQICSCDQDTATRRVPAKTKGATACISVFSICCLENADTENGATSVMIWTRCTTWESCRTTWWATSTSESWELCSRCLQAGQGWRSPECVDIITVSWGAPKD